MCIFACGLIYYLIFFKYLFKKKTERYKYIHNISLKYVIEFSFTTRFYCVLLCKHAVKQDK